MARNRAQRQEAKRMRKEVKLQLKHIKANGKAARKAAKWGEMIRRSREK